MQEDMLQVPVGLRCAFRVCSTCGEPKLYGNMGMKGTSNLREIFAKQSSLPEGVTQFLVAMDAKLDMLLYHTIQERLEEEFPAQGRVTRLSVNEAVLECKEALAPEDILELVLFLNDFPVETLSVMGEVKNLCQEPPKSDPLHSAYHIAFDRLFVEEKEQIIRFLFQIERKLIRQKKDQE